jgi:hypothetical protein
MLPSADRTPTSPILEHNSKYSNKRAYLFLMLIDNARKSQHMATKPLPIFSRWTLSVITASQPASHHHLDSKKITEPVPPIH